jgi:hypothetical protein
MHFSKLSFDEYMAQVAALIGTSTSDSRIIAATSRFGYSEDRLKEGEQHFKAVLKLNQSQELAMQEKLVAHNERRKLHALLRKDYMKMLQIARIAFDKDAIITKALQLDGPRMVNLDTWMDQVALFGTRLLAEERWLKMLHQFGIGRKDIQKLMDSLDHLRSVALLCEQTKKESKQQTAAKRLKLKELQEWIRNYLKIAKIALDEQPELYQQLKM